MRGEFTLDPKEADRELILRGFAFEQSWKTFGPPAKSFLNTELKRVNSMSDAGQEAEVQRLRNQFHKVMRVAREIFGADGAFRRWDTAAASWEAKSPAQTTVVWDALYGILAELLLDRSEVDFVTSKTDILEAVKGVVQTDGTEFANARLSRKALTSRRDALKRAICECLPTMGDNDSSARRRGFDRTDVRVLFEQQNGKCGICQEPMNEDQIHDGSYSHIDHIKPYSRGGRTDWDNAQLTHRACNQSKGAGYDGDQTCQ